MGKTEDIIKENKQILSEEALSQCLLRQEVELVDTHLESPLYLLIEKRNGKIHQLSNSIVHESNDLQRCIQIIVKRPLTAPNERQIMLEDDSKDLGQQVKHILKESFNSS